MVLAPGVRRFERVAFIVGGFGAREDRRTDRPCEAVDDLFDRLARERLGLARGGAEPRTPEQPRGLRKGRGAPWASGGVLDGGGGFTGIAGGAGAPGSPAIGATGCGTGFFFSFFLCFLCLTSCLPALAWLDWWVFAFARAFARFSLWLAPVLPALPAAGSVVEVAVVLIDRPPVQPRSREVSCAGPRQAEAARGGHGPVSRRLSDGAACAGASRDRYRQIGGETFAARARPFRASGRAGRGCGPLRRRP